MPDELVSSMITEELPDDTDRGFLLDGLPRTVTQADALDHALRARDRQLTAAILVHVPNDVVVERISGRRVCPNGHVIGGFALMALVALAWLAVLRGLRAGEPVVAAAL